MYHIKYNDNIKDTTYDDAVACVNASVLKNGYARYLFNGRRRRDW